MHGSIRHSPSGGSHPIAERQRSITTGIDMSKIFAAASVASLGLVVGSDLRAAGGAARIQWPLPRERRPPVGVWNRQHSPPVWQQDRYGEGIPTDD